MPAAATSAPVVSRLAGRPQAARLAAPACCARRWHRSPLLHGSSLRRQLSPGTSSQPGDSGSASTFQPQARPDRSADLGTGKYEAGVAFPVVSNVEEDKAKAKSKDDVVKELSRIYRRTVFDHQKWREHRSTGRYTRHIASIMGSRMVRGLAAPLLYIMGVATGVAAFNTLVEAGTFSEVLPGVKPLTMSGGGPFGLTSFALSLLLVFRTNASYARWLDARRTWGQLINRSRDITRQAITYFPPSDAALLDVLCRWAAAYSRSLMCHLREGEDVEEELSKVLLPYEVEAMLASKHRPNYCMQMLSEIVKSAHLPPPDTSAVVPAIPAAAAYRMDENLSIFEDICGTCERILRAPIPLSYTRHTSRFMMIWLTLLPFSLWDSVGWAMVPLCGIVSFLLLGIEEIGVSIEEPFSILPLEQMCDTIEANIRELAKLNSGGSSGGNGSTPALPPSAKDLLARGVAEHTLV